jgi:hypothetical protein
MKSFRLGHFAVATCFATLSLFVLSCPTSTVEAATLSVDHANTWSNYFYPLKVGWTCRESFSSSSVSGSETLTVSAVTKTANGVDVTVNQAGNTETQGTNVPTNSVLHYTLGRNGSLVSNSVNALIGANSAQTGGDSVFPSVQSLIAGHTGVSTVTATVPLSSSDISQLKGALKSGQNSLVMAVQLRSKGSLISNLRVPMGTVHKVLEVSTTLGSLKVTNAIPAAEKALVSALRPDFQKTSNFKTWYARGIGPVQVELAGLVIKATACGD